jgi:hypothetical protein
MINRVRRFITLPLFVGSNGSQSILAPESVRIAQRFKNKILSVREIPKFAPLGSYGGNIAHAQFKAMYSSLSVA